MSKNKKTRQQKIIADLKRKLSTPIHQPLPLQYRFENEKRLVSTPQKPTSEYSPQIVYHVKQDLLKTLYLTFSLIAIELSLFFLLKNHILKLPIITY